MAKTAKPDFDPKTFLATVNGGRSVSNYRNHQTVFSQGDPADAVFYIQEGRAKVCVISERGKEAVVALHKEGDFFGEGCLSGQPRRLATVAALTECVIMRIEKATMVRVLHEEPAFSEMFLAYLLARNARAEEDLVDQLFNSSEKRLARLLGLDGHALRSHDVEVWQRSHNPARRLPCPTSLTAGLASRTTRTLPAVPILHTVLPSGASIGGGTRSRYRLQLNGPRAPDQANGQNRRQAIPRARSVERLAQFDQPCGLIIS